MYKKLCFAIIFVVLFTFTGCACSQSESDTDNGDSITISILNNSSSDVYAMHIEYYISDEPAGGVYSCNADNSKLSYNSKTVFQLLKNDLPEDAAISDIEIELFLVDKLGNETPAWELLSINAVYGGSYEFVLTGSFANGFYTTYLASSSAISKCPASCCVSFT